MTNRSRILAFSWKTEEKSRLTSFKIATDSVKIRSRYLLDKSIEDYGNINVFNEAVQIAKIIININYIILCTEAIQEKSSILWAMAFSFLRFLDRTQWHTTVGRTPLDEWSACRRDLYLTTHNTQHRQTFMPLVGFEPTISAGDRP